MVVFYNNSRNFQIEIDDNEFSVLNIHPDFGNISFIQEFATRFTSNKKIQQIINSGEVYNCDVSMLSDKNNNTVYIVELYKDEDIISESPETDLPSIIMGLDELYPAKKKTFSLASPKSIKDTKISHFLVISSSLDNIIEYFKYNSIPEEIKGVKLYKDNWGCNSYQAILKVPSKLDTTIVRDMDDFFTIQYIPKPYEAELEKTFWGYKEITTLGKLKELADSVMEKDREELEL